MRIAINGFGRMGRLALRQSFDWEEIEIVHINETATDAAGSAHLLNFDSAHGRWQYEAVAKENHIMINGQAISYSSNRNIDDTDWASLEVDVVIEATGEFRTKESLQQ